MYYLAVGVGLFALVLGTLKVAPIEPGHSQQVAKMNKHAGVFPLRSLGFQPSGAMYCAISGVLEIAFGALLAFGRFDWPVFSAFVFLIMSVIGLQCQLALGDPPADFVLPLVLTVLLLIMLFGRNGLWSGRGGKVHLS